MLHSWGNMTTVDKIDNAIDSLFSKLNKTYQKEYTKLFKQSRKYKKPHKKLAELLKKSDVFTDAKDLFLASINKQSIKFMEQELAAISKASGVSVSRIAYYADFKTINNIYIDNIDDATREAINQNMGLYLYEDSKTAYTNVSKAIGKSLAQTKLLMSEALVTTTRNITKDAYNKIEKDLSKYVIKYEYMGPSDSKTSDFCSMYVGKIKTMAEWLAIKSDIFIKGGHFKCRHSLELVPVNKKDLK